MLDFEYSKVSIPYGFDALPHPEVWLKLGIVSHAIGQPVVHTARCEDQNTTSQNTINHTDRHFIQCSMRGGNVPGFPFERKVSAIGELLDHINPSRLRLRCDLHPLLPFPSGTNKIVHTTRDRKSTRLNSSH